VSGRSGDAEAFEAERPRLVRLAARMLDDRVEAEDVVQQAWLRLHGTDQEVKSLPAWLTTVTTRLCLDRLRAKVPLPEEPVDGPGADDDPADDVVRSDAVGEALSVVLDRLSPNERVAFVLHDGFGHDFAAVAAVLDSSPAAARKLASRARAKLAAPAPEAARVPADWEVVDAFLSAARGGELERLVLLLAPDVVVSADDMALALGTPARIEGREPVSSFFNGSAQAALPVFADGRPAAAWMHRGEARVVFDFTVAGGVVTAIRFRAEPGVLASVRTRRGDAEPGPRA
jgi:RNA polymerase sigma-70 factor (ECF subfamily)